MKTLLVPIDFSDNSLRAFEYAINLAARSEAEILLLHSADDASVVPGLSNGKREENKRMAQQKLEAMVATLDRDDVLVRYEI